MIDNSFALPEEGVFTSLTIGDTTTTGITNIIGPPSADSDLVTSEAVDTVITEDRARLDALENDVSDLQAFVDQDVTEDSSPSFSEPQITGGLRFPFIDSGATRKWWQIFEIDIDAFGKFCIMELTGREGGSFTPLTITCLFTQEPTALGGAYYFKYLAKENDSTLVLPQLVIYQNLVTNQRRFYIRTATTTRYTLYLSSNSYIIINKVDAGTGATPNNIDVNWTNVYDTEQLTGTELTYPPDMYINAGGISLWSSAKPSTPISYYRELSGTLTMSGCFVTPTYDVDYNASILNNTVTFTVHSLLQAADATSVMISNITDHPELLPSFQMASVIFVYNGPSHTEPGVFYVSPTGIIISRRCTTPPDAFQSGQPAGFVRTTFQWLL